MEVYLMNIGERAWQLLPELTSFQSISESPGEGKIAKFIHSTLAAHPYFQSNPGLLHLMPIEGAPNNPAVVAALVRGQGNKTIILMNHHDVVDIEDYGIYQDLAFNPFELTQNLDPATLPEAARADLLSGHWIFGRGTMDMLYGLAIQLAMMEEAAGSPDELSGNLLFLSVPDEENNSLGMRHGISLLRQLQNQYGLDYIVALNSEPHGYTNGGHVIQTGSDGKLLPLIYCFGKETHAGAVYDGLNAHLLLSEMTRMLELNPGFCDTSAGAISFPPTVLRAGDMKQGYNVSTPAAAWAYLNVFTLTTTPDTIMVKLVRLGQQAWANAMDRRNLSARAWEKIGGVHLKLTQWKPQVLTFAQLWDQCVQANGDSFVQEIELLTRKLQKDGVDLQRLTLEVVHETHRHCPDRDPKIVIALAPPFYPPVRNKGETNKELHVMKTVTDLQAYAGELGIRLDLEEYHRGISDLSYCMLQDAGAVINTVKDNCPAWDRAYHLPLEDIAQIDAPALNMGPWGRDVHKFTERIHVPFSRVILPKLLERLVKKLLET